MFRRTQSDEVIDDCKGIEGGFRICQLHVVADVGILGTFTFASLALFDLVPLLLQASSHLVPFVF